MRLGFPLMFLLFSCVYTDKVNNSVIHILNKDKNYANEKLRFDGCYTEIGGDEQVGYVKCPLVFYRDGIIASEEVGYGNIENWKRTGIRYYKSGVFSWGVFDVENDTIKAVIYLPYYGTGFMRTQFREAYFIGIIENSSYIRDWHRVPSRVDKVINKDIMDNGRMLKEQEKKRDFVFYKMPESVFPDSKLVWLNKYRHSGKTTK